MQNNNNYFILIAGSRTFNDYNLMCTVLDDLLKESTNKNITIVEGGARGADAFAGKYANEHNYNLQVVPAEWNKYGKSAGYRRNRKMHEIIAEHPDRSVICFWDGASKGTAHNFELAKEFNTPLTVYNYVTKQYVNV